jgi:hypothetical protein
VRVNHSTGETGSVRPRSCARDTALFMLFAFTVVGLVGKAVVLLSVLGSITRLFGAARRQRGHR